MLDAVRMRRVSAEVDRARSLIDGTQEERRELHFTTTMSFAVPEGGHGGRWFTSLGFGAEYLRYVNLTWFNLGRGPSTKKIYANKETDAPLFTVCTLLRALRFPKGCEHEVGPPAVVPEAHRARRGVNHCCALAHTDNPGRVAARAGAADRRR